MGYRGSIAAGRCAEMLGELLKRATPWTPTVPDQRSSEFDAAEIARLAGLEPLAYDREREVAAERLGCRVTHSIGSLSSNAALRPAVRARRCGSSEPRRRTNGEMRLPQRDRVFRRGCFCSIDVNLTMRGGTKTHSYRPAVILNQGASSDCRDSAMPRASSLSRMMSTVWRRSIHGDIALRRQDFISPLR
jgi:hypothetical protein